MKSFLSLIALASIVFAYPGQLLSERAITEKDYVIDKRDGCPRELTSGKFEFPHYITYISANEPDEVFGNQYDGLISPNDISTIFTFDIPASRADTNCTLEFIFPLQSQLQTSSYTYSGGGTFFVTAYDANSCASSQSSTSFNNQPESGFFDDFSPFHMEPGNAYTIGVGPCSYASGGCASVLVSSNDTIFSYFQDQGECPIGLYGGYS